MPPAVLFTANILVEVGHLILRAGPFAKFIILLLFVLSVVSWAIMVERAKRIRAAEMINSLFWKKYNEARDGNLGMGDLSEWCEKQRRHPLPAIFLFFSEEFWPLFQERVGDDPEEGSSLLFGMLARGMQRAQEEVIQSLQKGLTWLSTLASVAPFLGLLGTVWGIMGSFVQLGKQGSATLDVVGPGIAEALITTVCGLAVAIPAVVGYNYFMKKMQLQDAEMQKLGSRLADVIAEEKISVTSSRVERPVEY